jgi:hypothetical protein
VNGASLSITDKCVDLGIIRHSSFSYDNIRSVISKASRAAGMIYRVFSIRSTAFLINLFRTYVIPIFEYVSPVWSPAKLGLNDEIERVLRRYTKRLPVLRTLSYEQRLEHLGVCTLHDRRRLADVTMAFKVLHGLVDIQSSNIEISMSVLPTRGGGCNLTAHSASSVKISKTFSFRIANEWNSLPLAAKQAHTLRTFKSKFK